MYRMDSLNRYLTKDEQSTARQKYIMQQIQLNSNKQVFNDYIDQQASEEKYKNSVVLNPQIEKAQLLITKKTESKERSRENEEGRLHDNLLNIADEENARILLTNLADILNDEQIKLANDSWVGIMHKARKMFTKGVEKQTFINFVVGYIQNIEKEKQPVIIKQSEFKQEAEAIGPTDDIDTHELYAEDGKIEQSVKTERASYQYDYFAYKIGNYIRRLIKDGRIINSKTLAVTGKGHTNLFNRNMDQTNKLQIFAKELGQKFIQTQNVQLQLHGELSLIPLEEGIKLLQPFLIPMKGSGLSKTASRVYRNNIRFMIGAGAGEVLENRKQPRYVQLNKYMVNMDELEYKNVLVLKYVKNRNVHSKFKQKQVSEDVKSILMELLLNQTFNNILYDKLTNMDKIVIYDFLNACHVDVGLLSMEDKQKVYDTLLGEYQSGNNNPKILSELRSIIVNAIENKEIEVQKGLIMLAELK